MGRHLLSCDDEMEEYLRGILDNLKNLGIKNASKTDALRYVINMNKKSKLQPVRLRKKKPRVNGGIDFI